ncbi:NAD(P)/FAD-dependent oxidoreductase [Chloroflexia bacterium SDU3-3]|nr:NAD(P)/FAD-dependent oxidoreductase [Chloroflexia bacterium SDU3-3]
MMQKKQLVVIGNGMAGARAVEEIVARGGNDIFEITMIGDEPYGNYNRILLSNVLNGTQRSEEIFLNPLEWYETNQVRLLAGVRATAIHRATRTVELADKTQVPYDQLLIATGSSPFVPPMDGLRTPDGKLKPGAFVFRTIDDCTRIAEWAQESRSAVVIGGGLLGLEAARGLTTYGCDVHVIQIMPYLMNQQLDMSSGTMLKYSMEQMGIHVHVGVATEKLLGKERIEGLAFKDGSKLACDMVVISAGIRPNVDLAKDAGLMVDRAIMVDDQLRTSDSRIFAVGECVQHRSVVYGLVAPLWEQAKVLAEHLTGRNPQAAYLGSKLATKLKVMGVELASMGVVEPRDDRDEVVQFSEPRRGRYKKLIIRENRLAGAILLGDTAKAGSLMQMFDRETPLPEDRAALLFDLGQAAQQSVGDLPDDTQICNCNGVSKGAIRACVLAGKRSPKAVMDATRAGMGCGSCKSNVAKLVEHFCEGEMVEDPSAHYYVPGVPLAKPELVEAITARGLRSVSAVFATLAGGLEDPASKPGLASLLKTIWGAEYEDERDARFINDRVHGNIQRDGTFSVVPQMPGGVTTPADLRRIAEVAEKYQVPLVKLTGGQRIDLLGIRKDDLPNVWADLGMPSGYAYAKSFRTCKSCVGTDFCRYGLGDSMGLAKEIEQRFHGLESPAKIKMGTTGCPRNCSEAYIKDVGAVAIEGGRWELYVGGAGGAHVRKGDLLCTVETHADVLKYAGRFIQYYRENAKYLERTYGFVERVGIAKIRAVVVDDAEGIAERLDAAMQHSVDAYTDPWLEAHRPKTANQFASTIPLVAAHEGSL